MAKEAKEHDKLAKAHAKASANSKRAQACRMLRLRKSTSLITGDLRFKLHTDPQTGESTTALDAKVKDMEAKRASSATKGKKIFYTVTVKVSLLFSAEACIIYCR